MDVVKTMKKSQTLIIYYIALLFFTTTANAGFYKNAVLADNPLGYWELDETSGNTALDSSGNGNNGTYFGGITQGMVGAFSGSSATQFDGSTGYVDLGGVWGGANELTIEAWANVSSITGDFQAIVSSLAGFQFAHLQLFSAGNIVTYTDSGALAFDILSQNPTDDWRHIALVAESGNSKLYVNGIEVSSNSGVFTSINAAPSIRIGSGHAGGRFFNGLIDDVAIYDHALSSSDINRHLSATTVPAPPAIWLFTVGLIGLVRKRKN